MLNGVLGGLGPVGVRRAVGRLLGHRGRATGSACIPGLLWISVPRPLAVEDANPVAAPRVLMSAIPRRVPEIMTTIDPDPGRAGH
ncbi:hypothetical protein AXA44_44995 [Rhodococcus sp. SC4]|nr:hypothetical protein AXA44_44995 [Rhodococcus sp. SC4]